MDIIIRKATASDIDAVADIYDKIHAEEDAGLGCSGWRTGVYPVRETAEGSLKKDELYVMESGDTIVATARINGEQDDAYADCSWSIDARDENILVLHTLVVDPGKRGCGFASAFVTFYEDMAKKLGCKALRMDTNVINTKARRLYAKLGYREAGVIVCEFNGIDGVNLVCLEKEVL